MNVAASIRRDQIGSLDRKVAYNNQESSNMYPYLLEFTISRHFSISAAHNSRLSHLRFGGNVGVLCLGTSATASKPTLDFAGTRL